MGLVWRVARRLMTPDTEAWVQFADVDPMVEETILRPPNVPGTTPLALMDTDAAGTGGGNAQSTLQVPSQRKMKMIKTYSR